MLALLLYLWLGPRPALLELMTELVLALAVIGGGGGRRAARTANQLLRRTRRRPVLAA